MPSKTPESLKNEVISLHLLGNTNIQIAKNVRTSTGNISNIINEFKKDVDTGDYQSIRILANQCHKNGMTISNALEGHATHSFLKKNNVNGNDLEKFIELFIIKENNLDIQTLLDFSIKLCKIQNQTQIDIMDIPEHYESLLENISKLKSNITVLEEQEADQKSKTAEELKKRNITIKILDEFDSAKNILHRDGLDIEDYSNFAKMVDKVRSLGYNIEEIKEHLDKENSHQKRILDLDTKLKNQEKTEKQNQNRLDKQDLEIKQNMELIKTIDKFTSLKISKDHLEHLYAKLICTANKHKISHLKSYEQFYDVLELYDKQLGFEKHIEALTNKLNSLTKQQSVLETDIEQNTNKISSLKSEKIKLETYIDTLKSKSINVLESYDKKLISSLEHQLEMAKNEFSNFRLMLLEALSYYSNKDGKILSSCVDLFTKHVQKIIESNDKLGSIHTIRKINDLLEGKGDDYEMEQLMIVILTSYFERCKQKNNKLYEKYIKDLLNTMLSTS